jgi:hypothetical protein
MVRNQYKRSSGCGQLHEMPLGKDTLSCDFGLMIDRDLNASIILKSAASSAVGASGERVALALPSQRETTLNEAGRDCLDYRDNHINFRGLEKL